MGPLGVVIYTRGSRPDKTLKHFYAPWERWEQISTDDPRELLIQATNEGCPYPTPWVKGVKDQQRLDPEQPYIPLLHQHHDQAYQPAYDRAHSYPESVMAPKTREANKSIVCSPNGIILVIGTKGKPIVMTAYRPRPQHGQSSMDDFKRQSRWVFKRDTGVDMHQYTWSDVDFLLKECESLPTHSPQWLSFQALALGIASLRAQSPDELEKVAQMRLHLAEAPPHSRRVFLGSMNTAFWIHPLLAALRDSDLEEADIALNHLEDGILTLHALGAQHEVDSVLYQLKREMQSRNLPIKLDELMQNRYGEIHPKAHPLQQLSTLSFPDKVLSFTKNTRAAKQSPLNTLAQARDTLLSQITAWFDVGLALSPVPVMGDKRQSWELSLTNSLPKGLQHRVFIVDSDYKGGSNVSKHIDSKAPSLWQVDQPGDSLTVVVIASPKSIPDYSLQELEEWASKENTAIVRYQTFTRPM